jgi:aspartate/methionine/tyrosine aminotransferase
MKLVNNPSNPTLLGTKATKKDLLEVARMVENLNRDLIDSGYEQYQARVEKSNDAIYILSK